MIPTQIILQSYDSMILVNFCPPLQDVYKFYQFTVNVTSFLGRALVCNACPELPTYNTTVRHWPSNRISRTIHVADALRKPSETCGIFMLSSKLSFRAYLDLLQNELDGSFRMKPVNGFLKNWFENCLDAATIQQHFWRRIRPIGFCKSYKWNPRVVWL